MMQGRKIKNNKEDLELVREDLSSIYTQRVRDSLVHGWMFICSSRREKIVFIFWRKKKRTKSTPKDHEVRR